MKRLLVVRHSKAEEGASDDHGRSLTDAGRQNAYQLGIKINAIPFHPDLALISTARRAQQTMDEIKKSLTHPSMKIQNAINLYQGRLYDVLKLIQSIDDKVTNLLIIGHNPVLTELINYVGDETIAHLNPGGSYLLEFAIDSWADLELVKAKMLLVDNLE